MEQSQTNIIAVDLPTWRTLIMLKENLRFMKSRNEEGRFNISINKQADLYRTIMKEAVQ